MINNIRYAVDRRIALLSDEPHKPSSMGQIRDKFKLYKKENGELKKLPRYRHPP
jgi:hypothetical protein